MALVEHSRKRIWPCTKSRRNLQSLTAIFNGYRKEQNETNMRLAALERQNHVIKTLLVQVLDRLSNGRAPTSGLALLLEGAGNTGLTTSSATATVPTEQVAANLPNRETGETIIPAPPDVFYEMEARPQALLRSLRNWTVRDLFVSWHTEEIYKHPIDTKVPGARQNRNVAKFVVEYLSLFLREQVPSLPAGAHPGTPSARQHASTIRRMANEAWEGFTQFYRAQKNDTTASPSEKTSAFKNFMKESDHTQWPDGPTGQSPFQPPGEPMKGKDALVALLTDTCAKRARATASEDGGAPKKRRKKKKKDNTAAAELAAADSDKAGNQ